MGLHITLKLLLMVASSYGSLARIRGFDGQNIGLLAVGRQHSQPFSLSQVMQLGDRPMCTTNALYDRHEVRLLSLFFSGFQ
ncbi:hypothetical protein [Pseudomonas sp. KCJK9016]|uniref:hypothetical protein n=1 Tax=Pseudomonas sp. KCJK9016 TaxID=3344556 RepID=UPI003906736E